MIRPPTRMGAVVLAVGVLAAGTACSSTVDSSSTLTAPSASASASLKPGSVTVSVKNFAFNPQKVTIPVGATVTWTFDDSAQHTATANDKSFSSPKLNNGAKYQHTFTKAGTYDYMCTIHSYMTGTVVVK